LQPAVNPPRTDQARNLARRRLPARQNSAPLRFDQAHSCAARRHVPMHCSTAHR